MIPMSEVSARDKLNAYRRALNLAIAASVAIMLIAVQYAALAH